MSLTSIGSEDAQVMLHPFVSSSIPVIRATIICLTGFASAILVFVSIDIIDIMYSDKIENIIITPATVSMLITDLDIALLKASLNDTGLIKPSFFVFFKLIKSLFKNLDIIIAPT